MIIVTRLNGSSFVVNADMIETVEANPDTTIRMVDKNYFIVKEEMDEVIRKVVEFRFACRQGFIGAKKMAEIEKGADKEA